LTLNAKIQVAVGVRLFIVDPRAAAAAMRTGVEINLAAVHAIC
jgi:hypothetical protein